MRYAMPSLVLALLITAPLRAASLPAQVVSDDAVFVVWLDASRLDPAQLSAAASAVLGDDAKMLDMPLKQFAALRDVYVAAGGESVAIVVRGPVESGRSPDPHFLLTLKQDADSRGMLQLLEAMGGEQFEVTQAGERMLMVASARQPSPPAGTGGERYKVVSKLLAGIGDVPAAVVFVPTAELRRLVAEEKRATAAGEWIMPGITKMVELLEHFIAAEHGLMTATLGEKAKLTLTITTKDADAATALTASIKPAAEAAAKLDATMRESNKGGNADPGTAILAALLADAQPKVEGSAVSIVLEDAALRKLGTAVVAGMIQARKAAHGAVLASNMHQMSVAMFNYLADHRGLYPDKLEDLKPYFSDEKVFAELLKHPATGESPAFKYVKPAARLPQLKKPDETGVLFELKDGKIDPQGHVAYADGHVARQPAKERVDDAE